MSIVALQHFILLGLGIALGGYFAILLIGRIALHLLILWAHIYCYFTRR